MRIEIAAREVLATSLGSLRAMVAGVDVFVTPAGAPWRGVGDAHACVAPHDDMNRACAHLAAAGVRAMPRFDAGLVTMDRPGHRPTVDRLAALSEIGGVAGVLIDAPGCDGVAAERVMRALLGSGLLPRFGMHRIGLAWRAPSDPTAMDCAAPLAPGSIDLQCERWTSLVRLARAAGHDPALLLDGPWSPGSVARVAIRMDCALPGTPIIADLDDTLRPGTTSEAELVAARATRLAALGLLRRYAGLDIGAKLTGRGAIAATIAHVDSLRLAVGLRDIATLDAIAP